MGIDSFSGLLNNARYLWPGNAYCLLSETVRLGYFRLSGVDANTRASGEAEPADRRIGPWNGTLLIGHRSIMRRGKFSRDSRGGGRQGGNGGGRRGGRGGRRGDRRGGRRFERASAQSGNQRERIAIESGHLVFIDQFMLANPQFIGRLAQLSDDDADGKDNLVKDYSGEVVDLEPGTYRIERDPYAFSIVIHRDGDAPQGEGLSRDTTDRIGQVFVDTRCLAMVDRELLDDRELLEKYQQLWFSGQDKACRDLLRDNGGAVRYGFQRYGDELGIFRMPDSDVVCLWPDVAEETQAQ